MTQRNRAVSVQEHITDAAVASAATKWGMGGGLMTSVFGWLSSNGAAVLIGITVTVGGFIVNYYYQRKRYRLAQAEHGLDKKMKLADDRRKEEMHQAQLKALQNRCDL